MFLMVQIIYPSIAKKSIKIIGNNEYANEKYYDKKYHTSLGSGNMNCYCK